MVYPAAMRLGEALRAAETRLDGSRVGSPRMNAEVLMMFVLGCNRAYLYAHPERELTTEEHARYDEALAQRARGVPAQYIVGHQEFWGLDFIVNPAVLIPRPETEHLVEAALELIRRVWHGSLWHGSVWHGSLTRAPGSETRATQTEATQTPATHSGPRIVDVGTGSGCVALALAHELPQAEILAVDISEAALEVARANAARLQLERVKFERRDVLEGAAPLHDFDFVVSNPPYVGASEEDKVQLEVRKFEPRMAVFAGPEGLDVIRRLIPQAREALRAGGWLLMEIGFSMEAAVRALLADWAEVRVHPDLQGIPRVVAARK